MMDRRRGLHHMLVPMVLSLLMLGLASFGASAQGGTITANGTFNGRHQSIGEYGEITTSGQLQLTFPRNGGSASGNLVADSARASDGTAIDHIYYLTLSGSFDGFPGGDIGGSVSGRFTDKAVADVIYRLDLLVCAIDRSASSDPASMPVCEDLTPDYDAHTLNVSGSWQGRLNEGGFGSGTYELTIPSYAVGENSFQARYVSGTWEVSSFTAGQAPALGLPSLPVISNLAGPPLFNAPALSPGNIPALAGASIAGAAAGLMLSQALAAVAASRAAATLPGGVVAGMRVGPGVELDWGGGTQSPLGQPPAPPGQARSPVDGSLVSAEQARHERAQLDAGYTYDPQREAFVYVPEKVEVLKAGPSYLSQQAQQEKAARDVVRSQQRKARANNLRAEQIREEMAWQEQDYLHHKADWERAERAITVLKTVEFVADVGVSTVAHFVPVVGPAIDKGYGWIKIAASGTSSAYYEGAGAGATDIAKRTFSKVLSDRFKPTGTPTFAPDQLLTKMGGEILTEHVVETTQDFVVSQGVDFVHNQGSQLVTGRP